MSNIILTQIPAQATFKFYIIITSAQLNPSFNMLTVKFIIEICFSASTFQFKAYQCYFIYHW